MTESEKRLRELIRERTYSDAARTQYEADIEALKSATRDAALEEAKRACESEPSAAVRGMVPVINTLKSQPAERYLRESEVRRVLSDLWNADRDRIPPSDLAVGDGVLEEAARRLGVDIDTKPAAEGDIYERGGLVLAKEER